MQLLFPVGYGVMDLNSNGEQIGDRCFLYPLPTEIEVEISHNSALIHVVLYLCISFVRHGKWSVKISTYRRTVPHRYLVHHLVFLIEMCKIIFFTNVKNQTTGFKLQFFYIHPSYDLIVIQSDYLLGHDSWPGLGAFTSFLWHFVQYEDKGGLRRWSKVFGEDIIDANGLE